MTSAPAPLRSRALSLLDRPYLILTLTVAFWGGNAVAGKAAVGNLDPYALTILRWVGAFLAILPFALPVLRADWPKIAARWWLYIIYGGIGYAAFNVFLYVAAYFTSGINIALDQVAINILVMVGNFAFYRTRVRPLQLVGVVLTILGVAATATHGDLSRLLALNMNFGDVLVLLACIGYAAYSLLLRYRPATDWKSFVFATFLVAFVTSLVFQATLGGGFGQLIAGLPQITPTGWAIALYTMLFPSLVSQMLYVRGVELIGPNRASLFINLIPLFGALGAVVILGEALQPFHLIAGAFIVVGIVLAEWSAQR
jgi:drug/metabolite transporter (DMT)-like permease